MAVVSGEEASPGTTGRMRAILAAGLIRPAPVALGLILLAGLAVRLTWWYGIVNVDPYAYADSAASIARWQPAFDPDLVGSLYYTQYIRLSLTVPAALLYRLFGPGEGVSTIAPVIASLGTAVVAFALATRVAGSVAGLAAAVLAALFPLSVVNSTQFLPDTMQTFFCALTMLSFLMALRGERSPRARVALFFCTGVTWALAFYARTTAIGLAIPFTVLFATSRPWRVEVLAGVPGALVVLAAAQILLLNLGGSPFQDLRTLLSEGRGQAPGGLRYTDIDFSYARYLLRDGMFLPLTIAAAGSFALAVLGARRALPRGPILDLAVLAVGQYLYFEFLMRLPGLYSWWKEPRYAMSMLVPVFALTGIALASWVRTRSPSARAPAAAWAVGVLSLFSLLSVHSVRADHAAWERQRVGRVEEELAEFLATQPRTPIYTWNDDLARYLSFYVGLDRATAYDRHRGMGAVRNRFDAEGRSIVEPGSFVAVEPGQDLDGLPTTVPDHWTKVWERDGIRVYRVPETMPAANTPAAGVRVAYPQEHILVRVTMVAPLERPVTVRAGFACAPVASALVTEPMRSFARVLPAGAATYDFDLPVDTLADGVRCRALVLGIPGTAGWVETGAVDVPVVRVVEPEDGFTVDRDLERARGSGWYRFHQPAFGAGGAAVALEPWRPLPVPIAPVPSGAYAVTLRVYDYADGNENRVAVDFDGVRREVTWGGGTDSVITFSVDFESVPAGGVLTITPLTQGQDGLLIDRVVVTGAP